MKRLLPFVLLLSLLACTPKLQTHLLTEAEILRSPAAVEQQDKRTLPGRFNARQRGPCSSTDNYIPDTLHTDHTTWRRIRLNFHFLDNSKQEYNFKEEEAIPFIKGLLTSANNDLRKNRKLWLPHGNDIPVIPTYIQLELTPDPTDPNDDGIYFHQDNEHCFYVHKGRNRNLYDRDLIKKYTVGGDSILNIFIIPHHPDSVASPTYHPGAVGVALGSAIKLAGFKEMGQEYWAYRGVLNHEVGHVFGLSHAWGSDGCDDTPLHNNECWNRSDEPPCDTKASNNMMDYNALQNALTPCQVGRIQYNTAREDSRGRKLLVKDWCSRDPAKTIRITDTIEWKGAKDLKGDLILAPDAQLTVHCRLSMPAGARIILEPGSRLVVAHTGRLHNSCGLQWGGVEVQERGQQKGILEVQGQGQIEDLELPAQSLLH